MKTLYAYCGLPASGKSSHAKELVAASDGKIKRVNKDSLRDCFDGGVWSKKNEREIIEIRDLLIKRWLNTGLSVCVDDTNFAWLDRLQEMAKENQAAFELIDFRHVDVATCIARDNARANGVGEAVIRKMAKRYLEPKAEYIDPPEHIEGAPSACIVDIDGTLALMSSGRGPFMWDRVGEDSPSLPIVGLVNLLRSSGEEILFVSGRDSVSRVQTRMWLKEHVGEWTSKSPLFMRPEKDNRKDSLIKREIYDQEIAGKYNIRLVLDDRRQVVLDCWRALGLTCLEVATSEF